MSRPSTKKLKTMIIKVPKAKPFDLSFKDTTENTKIIVALESLKSNAGWQFLTQVLEENIKFLSKQIISKFNGEKVLTDSEVDVLRDKYEYLTELLDKPDMFIKRLKREDGQDHNLDPYD